MSANPKGSLMCCLGCGRDTKSKGGYCHKCAGRSLASSKGYKTRAPNVVAEQDDNDDVIDEKSDYRYHGTHLE